MHLKQFKQKYFFYLALLACIFMLMNNWSVMYGAEATPYQSSVVNEYMDTHACCDTAEVDDVCQLHCDLISQLGLIHASVLLPQLVTFARGHSVPLWFLSRTISPDLHPPIA